MNLGNIFLPEPLVVWGLFMRCLGFVFLIAIGQLYWQVLPIAGTQGISPVQYKLQQVSRDYGPVKKSLLFPTLLWINASDGFLRMMIIIGTISSLFVIYGGILSFPALLLCWLIYLSLDIAVGLSYPWDSVLYEAGFLALFLPHLQALPDSKVEALPHPALAWAYRFLLFRLIFGFGKFKFWKSNWRDQGYFRSFMVNIPLPSYGAWYLSRFPSWFFLGVLYLTFIVEILSPPLIFLGPGPRLITAILVVTLMLSIWLISNFGFFNLITIVICIPLLDTKASILDIPVHAGNVQLHHILIYLVVSVVTVGGLLNLIFNSWCTFTWLHWPSALQVPSKWIRGLLAFYRNILRFRITHSYGVFPSESTPPIKWVPVFEGSSDGIHWQEYEYRFMATNEYSPPRFIAPYHPRLDHAIFYDSYGTNDSNFSWSLIGGGFPYEFAHTTAVESIMQRLLEGSPAVESLFRKSAFNQKSPPKWVRLYFYRFEPTSLKERKLTGKWWHRKPVGIHLPKRSLNTNYYAEREIRPELFHWDAVFWKDATTTIQQMQQTALTQNTHAIYAEAVKEMPVKIDEFWDDFLRSVEPDKSDWENLPLIRERLKKKYSFNELRRFELISCRLALQLEILLRPHFLQRKTPGMLIDNYFILGLYIHHILCKGRDVFEKIIANPEEVNTFIDDFEPSKAFYFYAVFWYDTLVFQSRKIRLAKEMGALQIKNELPGFTRLLDFLGTRFIDSEQEQWPQMKKDPRNGEWAIIDSLSAEK